jgi:hypothetical protein
MRKSIGRRNGEDNRDTMRAEYDFSAAVRGATTARYGPGAKVAVIDPEVLDVFPDGTAVNAALRTLAPFLRQRRRAGTKRRGA